MSDPDKIRKKNQRTLIMLVAAFALPYLIAKITFSIISDSEEFDTKNYGELVTPARPLEKLALTTIDGKAFGFEQLKLKWHLVYLAKGPCNKKCHDSLSKMHQARLGQGKGMSRVRLLYITDSKLSQDKIDALSKKYNRLSVLTGDEKAIEEVSRLFQTQNGVNAMEDNRIYLIDTLGNLMMQYKSDIALIGIIKDLEHLLKFSHIG